MKKKIEEVINRIQKSDKIAEENKPLIIEKIEEWRKEKSAVNDIAVKLENWWIEVEPIFAELGLI
jgi:predicted nucleic-acid-binding protein